MSTENDNVGILKDLNDVTDHEETRLEYIEAIKEKEGTTAAEKERALILLGTFMIAAGLLTGEAFFGTESSVLSFIDSLISENSPEFASSTSWYILRMAGFILLNVSIGAIIYFLFKRAGVIGNGSSENDTDPVKS